MVSVWTPCCTWVGCVDQVLESVSAHAEALYEIDVLLTLYPAGESLVVQV
jgi:hypothetical protein